MRENYKHSDETIAKLRKSHLGKVNPMKGKQYPIEVRNKMSEAHKGKKLTSEHKEKIRLSSIGRKHTEHTKKKLSIIHSGKPKLHIRGENNPNWKGGVTNKNNQLRKSLEYKLWRRAVFERDKYKCIWCGDKTSGNLEADHIKPFAYYPELRFAIDNGRTLCKECHKKTDTYLRRLDINN